MSADKTLNTQHPQHTAPYPNSSPGVSSTQPPNAEKAAPQLSTQTSPAQPAYTFSLTKLASSGIVMLQLQWHHSKQTTNTVTSIDLAPGSCKTEAATDRATAASSSLPNCRPAKVVHMILDDLQAGKLSPPE